MIMMQQVLSDLEAMGGDKSKLMQKYGEQQKELLKPYGGNIGDLPYDKEHPYYKLQAKIQTLGTL